ncbi:MAG: peptidoglycan DD-metalloendopeptidase family protein [Oscillospiraceae bacterium]|nr:peptidoglycan DD-metalloendopeptidase family protein [Oscillospiraceae bacterium]MDY4104703.1 peptidoglycan DD-metalloendopeptidase family protein [Oscillospiraceae bacterium]
MKLKKSWRKALSLTLCGVVLAASVVVGPLTTPAQAVSQWEIDALQQQKDAIAQNKKDQQAALDALQAEQAGYIEQKTALDKQQEMAVEEINLTKEQLEMYQAMIEEKQAEADQAQADADAQLVKYKEHLRNMEEQGMFNFYLSILFGADSFSDLLARIDMISEIMEYDKQVEEDYKDARDFALEVKAEYEAYEAELSVKAEELQAEIDALQAELEATQQQIDALQNDIDSYTAAYAEYAADEDRVQAEIDRLTEELKKQNTPVASSGSYAWPCPSCYTITSNYGYRYLELYGYTRLHAGVDIGAQYGASVTAAASGSVTVATYSSSYGNYVMIYHADGSSTVYAHMSSLAVSAGQYVNQGDVIGYVGSTGNSTGPHLHFEVRINGSTVDPMQFF